MCSSCGFYCSGTLWKRGTVKNQSGNDKEAWYCGLEWSCFEVLFESAYQRIIAHYKTEAATWGYIGCGRRYYPWARGAACVLEFRNRSGGWNCLLADVAPPALQRVMTAARREFYATFRGITADDLRGAIPVTVPKLNAFADVSGCVIPGVGKLDIAAYKSNNNPVMDEAGWWRFARAVASRSMGPLHAVFEAATRALDCLGQPYLVSEGPVVDPNDPIIDVVYEEEETEDYWRTGASG